MLGELSNHVIVASEVLSHRLGPDRSERLAVDLLDERDVHLTVGRPSVRLDEITLDVPAERLELASQPFARGLVEHLDLPVAEPGSAE